MAVKIRSNVKRMSFEGWARRNNRPHFEDKTGWNGQPYRVVYSTDRGLWHLSDFVVTSRSGPVVLLAPCLRED